VLIDSDAEERTVSNIDHYRALAAAAKLKAEEATLPSVRDRYERSAEAWQVIVDQMSATEQLASVNQAAKEAA
jgi:hypothetical protein